MTSLCYSTSLQCSMGSTRRSRYSISYSITWAAKSRAGGTDATCSAHYNRLEEVATKGQAESNTRGRFDPRTWIGLVGWAAMFCIVIVRTLMGSSHSVTAIYVLAGKDFLQGKQIYPDLGVIGPIMGYLYLPGFTFLYMPFGWMGPQIGDAIWKAVGLVLLTYAAWSTCRYVANRHLRIQMFSFALAISIPLVAGGFSNGQGNIHMMAACWLMTLSAFRGQAFRAMFWAGLAILKPLAIVMVLLIAGLRPRMIPALVGGITWAIAMPFIVADWQYVLSLYRQYWTMMTTMTTAVDFDTADFTAILSKLNWQLDPALIIVIRCAAALGTWALALWLSLRLPQNIAALAVIVLGASYMCLFNPRAEGVTYSIIALPIAIVIGLYLQAGRGRAWWTASAITLFVAGTNGIARGIFEPTRIWFKPAMTVLLLVLMAVALQSYMLADGDTTRRAQSVA